MICLGLQTVMILPGNAPESIAAAADCIRAGGLVGLPTETVYGLAADADNDAAVAQIFATKGRPADHPLIVHVASSAAVAHYAQDVPDFARALMEAFWPGPLTLILPRRPGVANAAAGGNPTIGLRCPSHPVAQALLNWGQIPINSPHDSENPKQLESDPNCFCGLAAPSANKFGRVSPTTAQHVQDEFGPALLVLDGGPCAVGIESTIIDCTRGAPVLLRPGAVTPTQIQAACGQKVLSNQDISAQTNQGPKASGTLDSHYAPQALVRLMDAPELQAALQAQQAQGEPNNSVTIVPVAGLLTDGLNRATDTATPLLAIWSRTALNLPSGRVVHRPMPLDARAAAHQLFATLRAFDAQGVAQIWVETPPASAEWEGVWDRLRRAAHRAL